MNAQLGAASSNDALTQRNLMLWRALQKVQDGDLEGAASLLADSPSPVASIGEVFRLYQEELETQAQQLRDSQQRAEQALGWFAYLFRSLPVAAVMVDAQGLVIDANEHARRDLGLAALERSAPVPLRRLMADAQGEQQLAAALAVAEAEGCAAVDLVRLRLPGGGRRVVDLRITRLPPRDQGHERPTALCVLHDRTEQLDAQHARDAALKAEGARDVAQAAAGAKTTMMSRLSHELRTPLNAVLGFSQLLLGDADPLTARQRHRLDLIQDAGRNLLALVDDVLLLNRLSANGTQLNLQRVALQGVVADVLALQEQQMDLRGLTLLTDSSSGEEPAVEAWADPRRVREILINLVSNAIKYNRHGGQLEIHCRTEGERAAVAVRDTGIGLTPLQMSHLFEPFNRLGAENSPVEGTGLGLSIANTLAHAMHGEIRVQSEPGQGSTFSLLLPLASQHVRALELDDAGPGRPSYPGH